MGGHKEATHRLLSLAPAPDHSPHPPPRPRARHDLILCSKTPPCLPGSPAFADRGASLASNLGEMGLSAHSQGRDQERKTGSCHTHVGACGLYSCPPTKKSQSLGPSPKQNRQGPGALGYTLQVPYPRHSREPEVYKVLVCDDLMGKAERIKSPTPGPRQQEEELCSWKGRELP